MKSNGPDRSDIERVFSTYLRSLEAADVALASQVWLQSPDVLVVTPIGRFQGWDGVKEIWAQPARSDAFALRPQVLHTAICLPTTAPPGGRLKDDVG